MCPPETFKKNLAKKLWLLHRKKPASTTMKSTLEKLWHHNYEFCICKNVALMNKTKFMCMPFHTNVICQQESFGQKLLQTFTLFTKVKTPWRIKRTTCHVFTLQFTLRQLTCNREGLNAKSNLSFVKKKKTFNVEPVTWHLLLMPEAVVGTQTSP